MGFQETLDALQRAIYEDPEDDGRRLAFARHVAPVDAKRAELIDLQVERIRADRAAGRFDSRPSRREVALLEERGDDWAQLIEPYARVRWTEGWEFNRGFVEQLTTDAAIFTELGENLLRLGPILHLDLIADGTDVREVLANPALSRLVSLELPGWSLDDDAARAIAASPNLGSLVKLHLAGNKLTEVGVSALAASPRLRKVLTIDLANNPDAGDHLAVDNASYDEHGRIVFTPNPLGVELEKKHGRIPWLHPDLTEGADRFHLLDAARKHGLR